MNRQLATKYNCEKINNRKLFVSFKLSIFFIALFIYFFFFLDEKLFLGWLTVVHFSFLQNRSLRQRGIPLAWFTAETRTTFRTATRKSTLLCMETDEPIAQCFQAKHWLVPSTSARFWFDRNLNVHSNDGFMFETRALFPSLSLSPFATSKCTCPKFHSKKKKREKKNYSSLIYHVVTWNVNFSKKKKSIVEKKLQ